MTPFSTITETVRSIVKYQTKNTPTNKGVMNKLLTYVKSLTMSESIDG
jgi:hypothetical protein